MNKQLRNGMSIFAVGLFFAAAAGGYAPVIASGNSSGPRASEYVRTWGGISADGKTQYDASAGATAVDESGNMYVVGSFTGVIDFNPDPLNVDLHSSYGGSIDAYLTKYDSSGLYQWTKTWGGSDRDVAYGVEVDNLGNAYVVGPYRYTVDFNPDPAVDDMHTSNFPGENNIYVSKFSPGGSLVWVRTWGPAPVPDRISSGAEAYHAVVRDDSLYVVGDFSGDLTDFNPWGSHDWHQNHYPNKLTDPILFDAFLAKFSLDGSFQWAKTWGGEGYDDGPGIALDSDGNIYDAGMYASQTINFDPAGGSGGLGHPAHDSGILVDVFLSKFDANGNFQWVRTWGGTGTDEATGLVAVDGTHVYVVGRFGCSACDFDPTAGTENHSSSGLLDAFISQLDTNGNFHWAKTWGANASDEGTGLAVDSAGRVYVAGRFMGTVDLDPGSTVDNHTSNGGYDIFLSQFNSSGAFLWSKTWGGSLDDFSGVSLDRADGVYAYGKFAGQVDFDPGSASDLHTSIGSSDTFISSFYPPLTMFLPLMER